MATYAALLSQLQLLHHLHLSDQYPLQNSQINPLQTLLSYLKVFLEDLSPLQRTSSNDSLRDLEIQIRDAVLEAEDAIESAKDITFSSALQKIDLIAARAKDFHGDAPPARGSFDDAPARDFQLGLNPKARGKYPAHDALSRGELEGDNLLMGRNRDLQELIDRLSGSDTMRSLQVVPIVGIRGVGKTLLAKYVYKDGRTRRHFRIRGWVSLRDDYSKRDILLGLLRSMKKLQDDDDDNQRTDEQLTRHLYKCLMHKRYLAVLDNVSSIESSSNALKELFPNQGNGSRVVVTTRNMDVPGSTSYISVIGQPHVLMPLTYKENFFLLKMIVFPSGMCPPYVRDDVMKISSVCKGLPLATITMGRLLAWTGYRIQNWRHILTLVRECRSYDVLIDVLVALTYSLLPQLLKALLLDLAMFPHNYEVPVSKLINLWIAEGYLQPSRSKAVEEIGEECLLQLIRRGIVLLCEWRSNGRVRTCRINDVFRGFIVKKAEEDKHFYAINNLGDDHGFLDDNYSHQRRLVIHKNVFSSFKETSHYIPEAALSLARSLLYTGPQDRYPLRAWLDFKLLRVLDATAIRFYNFPPEIVKLVWLRYLAFSYNGKLPSSISKFPCLQVLIIVQYLRTKSLGSPSYLPMEIWDMKELRHLHVMGSDLPDPCPKESNNRPLLENLMTLLGVSARSCTPWILEQIPNLKKLGVEIGQHDAPSFFRHLYILNRLESLKCVFIQFPEAGPQSFASITLAFPHGLKKLTLNGSRFSWECMQAIAGLPNLEVLKLRNYAFCGPAWTLGDTDEFGSLKLLVMDGLNIAHWIGERRHFPVLVRLVVKHCYKLQEIPGGFGQIQSLETIESVDCRPSIVGSARCIEEEQNEAGNGGFESEVYYSFDDDVDV